MQENLGSKQLPNPKHYFPGKIFSIDWLRHSVAQTQLLPADQFCLLKIEYHPTPHQRTRFTMRELIKIFQVTEQFQSKKNKNQVYWQRFIRQGYFPGRSVNSVNAQWQRFCHYESVEMALEKAVQLGMPYSTGQQGLPANLKHIKQEIIKQEMMRERAGEESLLVKRLASASVY